MFLYGLRLDSICTLCYLLWIHSSGVCLSLWIAQSASASENPGLQSRVWGIKVRHCKAQHYVFFFLWIELSSPRHVQSASTPNIEVIAASQVRPLQHFPSTTFISCLQHPYSVSPSHNPTQSTAWPRTARIQQDFCTSLCSTLLTCFLCYWKRKDCRQLVVQPQKN